MRFPYSKIALVMVLRFDILPTVQKAARGWSGLSRTLGRVPLARIGFLSQNPDQGEFH
jgi:hypothetical protein